MKLPDDWKEKMIKEETDRTDILYSKIKDLIEWCRDGDGREVKFKFYHCTDKDNDPSTLTSLEIEDSRAGVWLEIYEDDTMDTINEEYLERLYSKTYKNIITLKEEGYIEKGGSLCHLLET